MEMKFLRAIAAAFALFLMCSCSQNSGPLVSTSGSMAQMIPDGNELYYYAAGNVQVIDMTNPAAPVPRYDVPLRNMIGFSGEQALPAATMSIFENYLLVGMDDSVAVLDISDRSVPPALTGYVIHRFAKDPVLGYKGKIYSTTRSAAGTTDDDRLTVYQLENDEKNGGFVLRETWRGFFHNPHGIAFMNGLLLVADGIDGIKGLTLKDGYPDSMVLHVENVIGYDILPAGDAVFISSDLQILKGKIEDNTFIAGSSLPVAGRDHIDGRKLIRHPLYLVRRAAEALWSIITAFLLFLLIIIASIVGLVTSPFWGLGLLIHPAVGILSFVAALIAFFMIRYSLKEKKAPDAAKQELIQTAADEPQRQESDEMNSSKSPPSA